MELQSDSILVPDFRSRTGLFSANQSQHAVKATGKHLFDASVYRTDAATTQFHDMVRTLAHLVDASKPTAFHHLLARLAAEGRLLRLYTQNVDGLDASLPSLATQIPLNSKAPWPKTIQLHGGLTKMVCQKCHHLSDFEASLFEGPHPPACKDCVELDAVRTTVAGKRSHGIGRLRPRIVLYNEHNPDEDAIGAVSQADLKSRPDALIVIGTSLKVRGVRRIVKEMCGVVRGRRDGLTVWINNGCRPMGRDFENCWDLIVNGDSDVVANIVDPTKSVSNSGEGEEVNEEDWAFMKSRKGPQVVLNSPRKSESKRTIEDLLQTFKDSTPRTQSESVEDSKEEVIKAVPEPNPPSKLPKERKKESVSKVLKPRVDGKITKPAKTKAGGTTKTKKKQLEVKGEQKISGVFKTSKPQASVAVQVEQKPKSDGPKAPKAVCQVSKGRVTKPDRIVKKTTQSRKRPSQSAAAVGLLSLAQPMMSAVSAGGGGGGDSNYDQLPVPEAPTSPLTSPSKILPQPDQSTPQM